MDGLLGFICGIRPATQQPPATFFINFSGPAHSLYSSSRLAARIAPSHHIALGVTLIQTRICLTVPTALCSINNGFLVEHGHAATLVMLPDPTHSKHLPHQHHLSLPLPAQLRLLLNTWLTIPQLLHRIQNNHPRRTHNLGRLGNLVSSLAHPAQNRPLATPKTNLHARPKPHPLHQRRRQSVLGQRTGPHVPRHRKARSRPPHPLWLSSRDQEAVPRQMGPRQRKH